MKKFLKRLLLFILPLLILSYPLDLFISKQLKKTKNDFSGEFLVWNDIYAGKINADIIIYGSSRAYNHINPFIFEKELGCKTYNLGLEGHNFWLHYYRHTQYMAHNYAPKYIIFSLDLWSFDKRSDLYNFGQFLPYLLFNNHIRYYTASYKGFSFFDYYIPLIRYVGNIRVINYAFENYLKKNNINGFRDKGYASSDSEWNDDFENAKTKIRYYEAMPDSLSMLLFDNFVAQCKDKNIELILVYTPEYIGGQKFTINRTEMMDMFYQLSYKHNLIFLDYSNDSLSYNRDYFYNVSHLNRTGSMLFTDKLIKDLQSINELNFSCNHN